MKIRFQADGDLNEDIVHGIQRRQQRSIFKPRRPLPCIVSPISEVLARASHARRILVSHDRRTMPRALAEFLRSNQNPGF
jgi:hypothetical protein